MASGSVNKVILVGNLGRDAELRATPGGLEVISFSAVSYTHLTLPTIYSV